MISIVYNTNREIPMFEWFAFSLQRQLDEVGEESADLVKEIIVIDFFVQFEPMNRNHLFKLNWCHPRLIPKINVVPPKPTVWQGMHRLTTQDYFAAANARNTGIALARQPYIVFVDDLSVLMPGWLANVIHAAKSNHVVAGSYRKVLNLTVEEGKVTDFKDHPSGHDSRWDRGSANGIVPCGGGDLFGCSVGCPVEVLLQLNGFDEICDSSGAEDYQLGLRLQNAGHKIWYNRNMLTYESEERHHIGVPFKRIIKPLPDGQIDASHVVLRKALNKQVKAHGNDFSLRQLNEQCRQADNIEKAYKILPVRKKPDRDWVDNQPLHEM